MLFGFKKSSHCLEIQPVNNPFTETKQIHLLRTDYPGRVKWSSSGVTRSRQWWGRSNREGDNYEPVTGDRWPVSGDRRLQEVGTYLANGPRRQQDGTNSAQLFRHSLMRPNVLGYYKFRQLDWNHRYINVIWMARCGAFIGLSLREQLGLQKNNKLSRKFHLRAYNIKNNVSFFVRPLCAPIPFIRLH